MKKIFSLFILILILLSGAQNAYALSDKQVDDIIKPGIVHILRTFSGTAQIPIVTYDAGVNQFVVIQEEVLTTEYNERDISTGFIVSPDGYIVTDPFITRENAIRDILATKYLSQVIDIDLPNDEDLKSSLLLQGKNVIAKNIRFIKNTEDLLIIGPLYSDGVNTEIVNKKYITNFNDTPAILKVSLENLPSLQIKSGKQGNFYYDYINLTPEIITENSFISNRRSINEKSLSFSNASFGGPVIAKDEPTIAGMIIFDRVLEKQNIISADKLLDSLRKVNVENKKGEYQTFMEKGFSFMEKSSCKKAVKEFNKAKKSTSIDVSSYVDPYIAQCMDLIASGRSKDTLSGFIKSFFENTLIFYFFVFVSAIGIAYLFIKTASQILEERFKK